MSTKMVLNCMFRVLLIIIGLFLGISVGCSNHDRDVACLKEKYSPEIINYFYETVYYQEDSGKIDTLVKWKDDIYAYLDGDMWSNDSMYVLYVANELNSLNLPVKMHLTQDVTKANVLIYFGDLLYLNKTYNIKEPITSDGFGIFERQKTYAKRAIIGISNTSEIYKTLNKSDAESFRQYVILQEITQILGVIGDSWRYRESAFSDGAKRTKNLSPIDKQVIELLYEPYFTKNNSRLQFEKDFGDVLYHVDAPHKIAQYMKENSIPLHYLEIIGQKSSFKDSTLYKFPSYAFVELENETTQDNMDFLKQSVNLVNSVTDKFNLEIIYYDISRNYPELTITYNDTTGIAYIEAVKYKSVDFDRMFPIVIKESIMFKYNSSDIKERTNRIKVKNIALFNAIYDAVGCNMSLDQDVIDIDSLGDLSFKPDCKEILALLYEPIFYSGISAKEIDEAIELMKSN